MRGMCSVAQWSTCSQIVQATTITLSNQQIPAHMGRAAGKDQHPCWDTRANTAHFQSTLQRAATQPNLNLTLIQCKLIWQLQEVLCLAVIDRGGCRRHGHAVGRMRAAAPCRAMAHGSPRSHSSHAVLLGLTPISPACFDYFCFMTLRCCRTPDDRSALAACTRARPTASPGHAAGLLRNRSLPRARAQRNGRPRRLLAHRRIRLGAAHAARIGRRCLLRGARSRAAGPAVGPAAGASNTAGIPSRHCPENTRVRALAGRGAPPAPCADRPPPCAAPARGARAHRPAAARRAAPMRSRAAGSAARRLASLDRPGDLVRLKGLVRRGIQIRRPTSRALKRPACLPGGCAPTRNLIGLCYGSLIGLHLCDHFRLHLRSQVRLRLRALRQGARRRAARRRRLRCARHRAQALLTAARQPWRGSVLCCPARAPCRLRGLLPRQRGRARRGSRR